MYFSLNFGFGFAILLKAKESSLREEAGRLGAKHRTRMGEPVRLRPLRQGVVTPKTMYLFFHSNKLKRI